MSRPRAREVAMKLIYSDMLGGCDTPEAVLDKSDIHETLDKDDITFCEAIKDGVIAHADELDTLISAHAKEWAIGRIARVDLAILRVCVYEMLYRPDVPNGASINEAVELAKLYGGEKSYAFINGILGSIERELHPEEDA